MNAICHLSLVPCRSEPSDRSEMVTQLLFGEHFRAEEERGSWLRIVAAADGYEGWIDAKQCREISDDFARRLDDGGFALGAETVQFLAAPSGLRFPVTAGCVLPGYDGKTCRIGDDVYAVTGRVRSADEEPDAERLAADARSLLGAPYLWGGRSPFGMDCSGFTQIVFRLNGILLPRDARQQAEEGKAADLLEEAAPGDLAFFRKEDSDAVSHVGIVLEGRQIIHASGQVRTDLLDEKGIYNREQKTYTHRLHSVRRLLPRRK